MSRICHLFLAGVLLAPATFAAGAVKAPSPDFVIVFIDDMSSLCDGSPNGAGVRPPGRVDHPRPLYPMEEDSRKKSRKAAKAVERTFCS